jgi:beta-1,4-mannosyl-glycoprotein beta-1,4-N-acetylglucosaminyltransferase
MPKGDNPWLRENYQRNCILRGISNAKSDDLIIVSDADEIPNPKKIQKFNIKKKYAVFEQKQYYYKLNLLNSTYPIWRGSKICVRKYLKSPQWLRELKIKKRPFWRIDKRNLNYSLKDGGWHFCNLKTPRSLVFKYKNLCEYKDNYAFSNAIDEKYLDLKTVERNINAKKDLLGRNEIFKRINIDQSYPDYLLNNLNKFKDWII